MDVLVAGKLTVLVDHRIVAEYVDVLRRPRLALAPAEVQRVLDAVERFGRSVVGELVPDLVLPDAADLPFVEVAVGGRADALVTGNARHFVPVAGSHDVPVLSPRAFLDALQDG